MGVANLITQWVKGPSDDGRQLPSKSSVSPKLNPPSLSLTCNSSNSSEEEVRCKSCSTPSDFTSLKSCTTNTCRVLTFFCIIWGFPLVKNRDTGCAVFVNYFWLCWSDRIYKPTAELTVTTSFIRMWSLEMWCRRKTCGRSSETHQEDKAWKPIRWNTSIHPFIHLLFFILGLLVRFTDLYFSLVCSSGITGK